MGRPLCRTLLVGIVEGFCLSCHELMSLRVRVVHGAPLRVSPHGVRCNACGKQRLVPLSEAEA